MQILRNIFVLLLFFAVFKLNTYSKQSSHTPAEAHVLTTYTYGLAGKYAI
jgi:hypothetical protein